MKPDIVAPGERIISAAAGELLRQAQQAAPDAEYIESTGTSMSAPHVSGAAPGCCRCTGSASVTPTGSRRC